MDVQHAWLHFLRRSVEAHVAGVRRAVNMLADTIGLLEGYCRWKSACRQKYGKRLLDTLHTLCSLATIVAAVTIASVTSREDQQVRGCGCLEVDWRLWPVWVLRQCLGRQIGGT